MSRNFLIENKNFLPSYSSTIQEIIHLPFWISSFCKCKVKESVTEFAYLLFHNHILHAVCKSYNIWKSLKGLVGKNCLCLFMLELQFLIRFFNWQFFLMIINWFSVLRIESIARKNSECVWATIFFCNDCLPS